MKWAIKDDVRVEATPCNKAICPLCNSEVIAKCGNIKVWHWSHKSLIDCDNWYEPESEWHRNWKNNFPKEQQEVIVKKEGKYHIADIKNKYNLVIELQNSSISSEDIQKREQFYDNMIWILNRNTLCKGLEFRKKFINISQQDLDGNANPIGRYTNYFTFRWYHPSKTWWTAKKPICIDCGEMVFMLKKIYSKCPCGGYGILLSKQEFLKRFK